MDNTRECAVSNTVKRNISAVGSYEAYGIMMIGTTIKPRLTDTTIRDISGYDGAGGIYMDYAENVSFDPTVIERVNAPNGEAYGIVAAIINGSFIDTTIRDIAGNSSAYGIYMEAINVSFLTGELTNCGHRVWLDSGDNNRIEGFIIRDNTLFDTGVHLEADASNTTVCLNCYLQ